MHCRDRITPNFGMTFAPQCGNTKLLKPDGLEATVWHVRMATLHGADNYGMVTCLKQGMLPAHFSQTQYAAARCLTLFAIRIRSEFMCPTTHMG
jgi:hypothetical protein